MAVSKPPVWRSSRGKSRRKLTFSSKTYMLYKYKCNLSSYLIDRIKHLRLLLWSQIFYFLFFFAYSEQKLVKSHAGEHFASSQIIQPPDRCGTYRCWLNCRISTQVCLGLVTIKGQFGDHCNMGQPIMMKYEVMTADEMHDNGPHLWINTDINKILGLLSICYSFLWKPLARPISLFVLFSDCDECVSQWLQHITPSCSSFSEWWCIFSLVLISFICRRILLARQIITVHAKGWISKCSE